MADKKKLRFFCFYFNFKGLNEIKYSKIKALPNGTFRATAKFCFMYLQSMNGGVNWEQYRKH